MPAQKLQHLIPRLDRLYWPSSVLTISGIAAKLRVGSFSVATLRIYCRFMRVSHHETNVPHFQSGSISLLGVNDDGSLEVHYVDYGNKDRVNKAETRSIADKYLELPIQGVNCRMNRIDFTQSLKPADHENFCMMVLNQNFTAKFVEYSPSSDVWLVELLHKTGMLIRF